MDFTSRLHALGSLIPSCRYLALLERERILLPAGVQGGLGAAGSSMWMKTALLKDSSG